MQHKAMHDIFGKGPSNDTTGEKQSIRTHSGLRDCQQDDCEQGRYQHLAEIDDCCHGPILGAAPSDAPGKPFASTSSCLTQTTVANPMPRLFDWVLQRLF